MKLLKYYRLQLYTINQWRKLDPISGGAEAYSQLIISNTPIFQFPK
jgi:hypothetical protein